MTLKRIISILAMITTFVVGAAGLQSAQAAEQRPVYFVAEINVVDQDKYFTGYVPEVSKYLKLGNAQVLYASKPTKILEGAWTHNWNVVIKFPSAADFDKFYLSEKYQRSAKPLRLKATNMNNMVLFEGSEATMSEEKQAPVYFMAKIKIDDKEKFFGAYIPEVKKHVRAGGGKILFGGFTPKQLEGDWGDYWTIFIQFPSQEGFDKFYNSEGNLNVAIPLRYQSTSENNVAIFKGAASPPQKGTENARHDFPYESHYVEVKGSKMHYVDTGGTGTPIVMLHGQPTWSYLWRNIIPYLEGNHRVIAVDLIGFGKSDKPNIGYTVENHAVYLGGFMDALALDDVTLVIHDWGSFLGFDYTARNPDRVKAIAFMEALLPYKNVMEYPLKPTAKPKNPKSFLGFITQVKTQGLGEKMIIENNAFLTQILPSAIVRKLSDDEMDAYLEPFAKGKNRLPMLQLPRSLVIDGENPPYVANSFTSFIPFLKQQTDLPLLMLAATPGGIGSEWQVNWVKENLPRTEIINVGEGIHFIQEDQPDNIGKALASWMKRNSF